MNWENLIINLECIDSLPTLPTVFMRVSQMLDDPMVTAKKIAEVIETDQAMAMKLLKIVNSPFFGFSRKIMTIQDAVVLLGFNATRNTIMTVSVIRSLNHPSQVKGFDMAEFWRHSIATGIISRYLSQKVGTEPAKAFVAGVIHDIGKIILEEYFRDELAQVMRLVQKKKLSFYQAELEVYHGTHCDLGSYLADKWNLPVALIEAIDFHHSPSEASEDPKLVAVVHIANGIAKSLGYGQSNLNREEEMDSYAFARLDISASQIEEWGEEIQQEIEKGSEMFQLLE
ncbi:MAG: HDOD domain-containing protein [Calditrichaeota bacterium]|nr:MAG: HDOD domain-containing protein [Calditrichota bacterium]